MDHNQCELGIAVWGLNQTQTIPLADFVCQQGSAGNDAGILTISKIGKIVIEMAGNVVVRATSFQDRQDAYRYCLRLIWGWVDLPVIEINTTGDSEVDLNSINNAFNEEFSSNEEFLKVMRENGVLMDLQRSDRDV